MYEPKPVAYCILDADMEKCEHIAYGVDDCPMDAVMLYDQYVVERLQRALEASEKANEYLRSHVVSNKEQEPPATAQEYISKVVVKFSDGHIEHHEYSDEKKLDNATIIAQVNKMFPPNSVVNVMIVEKQ